MNLSGILLVARPGAFHACVAALAALPGVEIHQRDEATGRIVVVQQATDVTAEVDAFARLRTLPDVLAADLVYHWFGDAPSPDPDPEAALARLAEGAGGPSAT